MTSVHASLFRLDDPRPPGSWEGAHGVVVLAQDGHLVGVKAQVADEDAWTRRTERMADELAAYAEGMATVRQRLAD